MAFENVGKISVFKNEKKEKPNQPDFNGIFDVDLRKAIERLKESFAHKEEVVKAFNVVLSQSFADDDHYKFGLWKRDAKSGQKYLGGTVQPKEDEPSQVAGLPIEDDIGW